MITANYKYSYLGPEKLLRRRSEEMIDLDSRVIPLVVQFYENFSVVHNLRTGRDVKIRIDTSDVKLNRTGPYVEIIDQQVNKSWGLICAADQLTKIIEIEFEGPVKETIKTEAYQAAMRPVNEIMQRNLLPSGTHIFSLNAA